MRKNLLKLGLGVMIAASTMLVPQASHAAHGALCVYSYTLSNGHTCTYSGLGANGCCQYTGDPHCHQICP